MPEKFTSQLRRQGEPVWLKIHDHPFLRELHAGSLARERFIYFVLQDYMYLLDFAQVLCLGGAKSPNLETLEIFARHALGALEVERSFHASFGKSLGLTRSQLDRTAKAPATQAYIHHLQCVARGGSLGEIVAAVLPCYWIYGEVGKRLFPGRPRRPKIYREWIELYASAAFWGPVREQLRLMDRLGAAADRAERQRMTEHFLLSSRYEFMFWDESYRMGEWPL